MRSLPVCRRQTRRIESSIGVLLLPHTPVRCSLRSNESINLLGIVHTGSWRGQWWLRRQKCFSRFAFATPCLGWYTLDGFHTARSLIHTRQYPIRLSWPRDESPRVTCSYDSDVTYCRVYMAALLLTFKGAFQGGAGLSRHKWVVTPTLLRVLVCILCGDEKLPLFLCMRSNVS